jgi:hypothetical protein
LDESSSQTTFFINSGSANAHNTRDMTKPMVKMITTLNSTRLHCFEMLGVASDSHGFILNFAILFITVHDDGSVV